ncbi:unnamed protein product, partial [Rotaria sp. Silwood2]
MVSAIENLAILLVTADRAVLGTQLEYMGRVPGRTLGGYTIVNSRFLS